MGEELARALGEDAQEVVLGAGQRHRLAGTRPRASPGRSEVADLQHRVGGRADRRSAARSRASSSSTLNGFVT